MHAAGDRPPHISTITAAAHIRMVAIDVDHTLIRDDHTLAAATVQAVRAARDAGVHVVLASSRPPLGMLPYLRQLDLVSGEPFIALQGAIIGSYADEDTFTAAHHAPMAIADFRQLSRIAENFNVPVGWYTGERWSVSHLDPAVQREADIIGFAPSLEDPEAVTEAPEKVLLIGDADSSGPLLEAVRGASAQLAAQRSNDRYVEITRSGVDKSSALRQLLTDNNLRPEHLVAIGDGENDLGMYSLAGCSIAPANAAPTVQRQALFSTDSNNDDGVAVALTTLLSARGGEGNVRQ